MFFSGSSHALIGFHRSVPAENINTETQVLSGSWVDRRAKALFLAVIKDHLASTR
jgi:hypothetical protein